MQRTPDSWASLATFSLYPPALCHGALRLLLFTLVPAGFIGFPPVALLRNFSWADLSLRLGDVADYSAPSSGCSVEDSAATSLGAASASGPDDA